MADRPATHIPGRGPDKQWGDDPGGGTRPWWKHTWTWALLALLLAVVVVVALFG